MTEIEKLEKQVEDALNVLSEHFDAIQICASVHENGFTSCVKRGRGNWYARVAMANEFVQQIRAGEIAEAIRPPEES